MKLLAQRNCGKDNNYVLVKHDDGKYAIYFTNITQTSFKNDDYISKRYLANYDGSKEEVLKKYENDEIEFKELLRFYKKEYERVKGTIYEDYARAVYSNLASSDKATRELIEVLRTA